MSIYQSSVIGKRKQNEDKHNVIVNVNGENQNMSNINYYGIYDGHGGKFVSNFLYENLPQCFMNKKMKYPLKKEFVNKLYEHIEIILKNKYFNKSKETGSTCLIVTHHDVKNAPYLNILNSGDSRCILCRNNIAVSLTKDHKPNLPEEYHRIGTAGGEIVFDGYDWRIGDLSVSRAFGDLNNKYVICNPDIYKYELNKSDKFIVLACDGLWDVADNQEVANYVLLKCYDKDIKKRINKHIDIAKELSDYALQKGSTDNLTIIVVFL